MTTAIAMLAARLLVPDGGDGRRVAIDGNDIRCVTLDQRETNERRLHAFICLDAVSGEVRGAFLRRNGKVFCPITGTYDGTCLTIEACGSQIRQC